MMNKLIAALVATTFVVGTAFAQAQPATPAVPLQDNPAAQSEKMPSKKVTHKKAKHKKSHSAAAK